MEVWSGAGTTAAGQAELGGGGRFEKIPGMKVGKLKCVPYSMCRAMMIIISREENAAQTKYSLL